MPRIPETQIKANLGENYVAYILSKHCLVRPVASGTDIGVDLYCEIISEEEPFLHFWVQVKTGDIKIKEGKAYYSFKREHLVYWYRQPVPVFAFLVPINSSNLPSKIYVVNITGHLLYNGLPNSSTKTLSSSHIIDPNDENSLRDFLHGYVPRTCAIKKISDGIVAPIPTLSPQYERKFVRGYSARYIQKILDTIRTTAAFASLDLLDLENENTKLKEYRKKLVAILSQFKDDKHYETHWALGRAAKAEGNFADAKKHLEDSLKIIKNDLKIDKKAWEPIKNKIRKQIEEINDLLSQKP